MYLGNLMVDENGNPITAGSDTGGGFDWSGAVTSVATAYQMKQLADVNAQRAAQGLPPVDMSALAPQVNVGLPPEQLRMLMLLGAGIIAAIYFSRSKG